MGKNFAVNVSDATAERGEEILKKLKQAGEKNEDALCRIFDIVEENLDGEQLVRSGVDSQALDASLSNIRAMFVAAATGKEQIIAEKDEKIAEVKRSRDLAEESLREKVKAAEEAKDKAVAEAERAIKESEQARREAAIAKEQSETAKHLADEKDKTNATLAAKLTESEEKLEGYDELRKERDQLADELEQTRNDAERARLKAELEHTKALSELEMATAKQIDQAKSEAEKARLEAELEHTKAVGELEKEVARLKAMVEMLEKGYARPTEPTD